MRTTRAEDACADLTTLPGDLVRSSRSSCFFRFTSASCTVSLVSQVFSHCAEQEADLVSYRTDLYFSAYPYIFVTLRGWERESTHLIGLSLNNLTADVTTLCLLPSYRGKRWPPVHRLSRRFRPLIRQYAPHSIRSSPPMRHH